MERESNPVNAIESHAITAASVVLLIDNGISACEMRVSISLRKGSDEINPLTIIPGKIRARKRTTVTAHDIH